MEFHFHRPPPGFLYTLPQVTLDLYANLNRSGVAANNWDCVRLLDWKLRSDGPVDQERCRAQIGIVGAARMRAALQQCALQVPTTDQNLAWQIAALGAETCQAVAETPTLLEYFVRELQPFDIETLL